MEIKKKIIKTKNEKYCTKTSEDFGVRFINIFISIPKKNSKYTFNILAS